MRRHFFFLVTLLACLLIPLRLSAQPLADRVPADAFIYAGWQGAGALKAQYESSHLKAVIESTTLSEFIQQQIPELLGRENPENARQYLEALEFFKTISQYPTAVYVGPLDLTHSDKPKVPVAVFCETGEQTQAYVERLQKIFKDSPPSEDFQLTSDTHSITLTMGKPNLDQAKLSDVPEFQKARKLLKVNAAIYCYVDAQRLIKAIDEVKSDETQVKFWQTVRNELKLDSFTQVAYAAGFDGPSWRSESIVGMKDAQNSVWARMKIVTPLATQDFQDIPESATWCMVKQFDVQEFCGILLEGILYKAMPDRAPQEVTRMISQAYMVTGVNLRDELINTLGSKWIAYRSPENGEGGSGFVFINQLKNPQVLAASLAKLENVYKAYQMIAQKQGQPAPVIQASKIDDMDVHFVALPTMSPAYTVYKGRLMVAMSPESLSAAAKQLTLDRNILNNEKLKAVQSQLGAKEICSIEYADAPLVAKDAVMMVSQVITMLNLNSPVMIPMSIVPPIKTLEEHLIPAATMSWADENGIRTAALHAFPGSQLISGEQTVSVAATSMVAAILLPSLGRARELANRSADAANLKGIAVSAAVWANENNDNMPERMGHMIITQQVSPKSFISKRGKLNAMPLEQDQIDKAIEKLRTTAKYDDQIADIVDQNSDYVYLGKGTRISADSSIILIYEKPGLSRDGFNVAYYDGHAEWIRLTTPEALAAKFAATNKYRAELKLQPVNTDSLFEQIAGTGR